MAFVKWFIGDNMASLKLARWPNTWGHISFGETSMTDDTLGWTTSSTMAEYNWSVGSIAIDADDYDTYPSFSYKTKVSTHYTRAKWCGNGGEIDLNWDGVEVTNTTFATHPLDSNFIRVTQRGVQYSSLEDIQAHRAYQAKNRIREIIQKRQAPTVITSRKGLRPTGDLREQRARETLRRIIGDGNFRNFLRTGFVTVKSKREGLTYQIYPGSDFTNVYQQGKMVERLCVVLLGNFPPTDSLIVRYLMIMNNPKQFRDLAIKHSVRKSIPAGQSQQEHRSLPEIFNNLKGRNLKGLASTTGMKVAV